MLFFLNAEMLAKVCKFVNHKLFRYFSFSKLRISNYWGESQLKKRGGIYGKFLINIGLLNLKDCITFLCYTMIFLFYIKG